MAGTLREVVDNDTTTRNKIYLNGLVLTKGKYGGMYMMPKKEWGLHKIILFLTTDPQ